MLSQQEQDNLARLGKKQEPRAIVRLPGRIKDAMLAPDGKHLIVANGNGTVYVLRVPAEK